MPSEPELRRKIFAITLSVYRLTDNWSATNMFRERIREKARDILELVIEYAYADAGSDARRHRAVGIRSACAVMRALLQLTSAEGADNRQAAAASAHLYGLVGNYFDRVIGEKMSDSDAAAAVVPLAPKNNDAFRDGETHDAISPSVEEKARSNMTARVSADRASRSVAEGADFGALNKRQERIIQYLKLHPEVKISDVASLGGGVSEKTIQRDLSDLVERRLVRKEGAKKWTVYRLNAYEEMRSLEA